MDVPAKDRGSMPQSAEKFLPSTLTKAGCAALALTSALSVLLGEPLAAASAAAAAGLCLAGSPLNNQHGKLPWPQLRYFFLGALALALVAALWLGPWSLSHWLYALPLATFALLPVYLAAPVTLVLLVLVLSSAQWLVNLPDRHQMVSAFVLTTLLAGILVFLREYKSRQLAPLRRTDELTQAASREYLSADLHKEIQRSEREGTNLSGDDDRPHTQPKCHRPDQSNRANPAKNRPFPQSQVPDLRYLLPGGRPQIPANSAGGKTCETAKKADLIRQGL